MRRPREKGLPGAPVSFFISLPLGGLPRKAFPLGGRWHGEAVTDEGAFPPKPSPRGEGGPKGRMRGQVSDLVRYPQGVFRRLRAATFFFHGEKEGKTPPGTQPMDYGSASLRLGP